jgi:hypothetical protein
MLQCINILANLLNLPVPEPNMALSQCNNSGENMPHTHAHSQAEAVHEALDEYVETHHHEPEVHEKARIISHTITQWVHEEVELKHASPPSA